MCRTWMQKLLLSICVDAAGRLAATLQRCTHVHGGRHCKAPMMALSALLCLRRRIRSMVVNRQTIHMLWTSGGDAYGRLSQIGQMLKSLDRHIYASEEMLIRRFSELIGNTVIRAYHGVSWTQRRWAVQDCLPSVPLRHLRFVLQSLHHGSAP